MEHPLFKLSPVKKGSERGDLIQFFVDNLRDKNGNKYPAKRIAIKLSHLKLPDLYYFKSVFIDILKRKGEDAAGKYFNWSLKVDKNITK